MNTPTLPRRILVTWTTLGCMFLASSVAAAALLIAPEWLGAGMCEGPCDGTASITVWWGLGLACLAAFCGVVAMGYAIAGAPDPDARIDAYLDADVRPPATPVVPREIQAARQRPAPSVFDRWIRP